MILEHQQHFQATFIYYPIDRTPYDGRAYNSVAVIARPDPNGWVFLESVRSGTTSYSTQSGTYRRVAAHDPDDERVIAWSYVRFPWSPPQSAELKAYSRTTASWSFPIDRNDLIMKELVPLAGRSFLVVDSSSALVFSGADVVDTITLPVAAGPRVRFTALRGPRFLMSWSNGDSLELRVVDSSGATLSRAVVIVPATDRLDSSIDYGVAESPRDSSIAVLIGGRRGARVTQLSRGLRTVYADSLLSETSGVVSNPSVVFHADTLFAVWEDMRDGVERIYGNRLPRHAPPATDTIDTPDTTANDVPDVISVTIAPNPARSEVYVTIDVTDAETLGIDLIDMLGRVIASSAAPTATRGPLRLAVDLSNVDVGGYYVRVRTTRGTLSRALMKR